MNNTINRVVGILGTESTENLISKEKLVNYFAKISQFITWPLLVVIFKILFDINIQGREIFNKISNPFIIIANHTSFYDSFLFRLILGFKTPHLPLRFMAVNSFESHHMNFLASIGVIDFVYSLFGVFTVVPGLGIDKNLIKAKNIIYSGGNIVIYPEGRINKNRNIGDFKKGASYLYKQTGVEVIPVSIKKVGKGVLRSKILIKVGNKIEVSRSKSAEDITMIMRNTIVDLYEKDLLSDSNIYNSKNI